MYEQAYLIAIYILGRDYHSGMWSKGYRLYCLAENRVEREFPGWNISRTVSQLEEHRLYSKGCNFRNAVAFWLKNLRKYRNKL